MTCFEMQNTRTVDKKWWKFRCKGKEEYVCSPFFLLFLLVIKARGKNVEHTSLERYWPKSPLPSRSSLHSSNDPTGCADPGRTLSFLSMRWKDISNRQLQTSSVTKIETFCFSLTPCPEPDVRFLTKPSVDACATFFCLDAISLSTAYNRQPQKMFNGSRDA